MFTLTLDEYRYSYYLGDSPIKTYRVEINRDTKLSKSQLELILDIMHKEINKNE